MLKLIFSSLMLVLSFFIGQAYAADASAPSVGQVQLDLLHKLESDGYLSAKLAAEAKGKYVDVKSLQMTGAAQASAKEPSLWDKYASWTNVCKTVAVMLLLLGFWGVITRITKGFWVLLVMVPPWLYQAGFLAPSLTATLRPDLIWASQAPYVALLGAIVNLMVLLWVGSSYPKLVATLAKFFNLGIPLGSVISFWLMVYFGVLAICYQSSLFGFAAVAALSGVFSFGLYYMPGVLVLDFKEKALPAVVFGHLVVLLAYGAAVAFGVLPVQAKYFTAGLEYYTTIAMGVGLLVGASPWARSSEPTGLYILTFILAMVLASVGASFYGLSAIAGVLSVFAVLVVLEWVGFIGFQCGLIVFAFVTGGCLYGVALLLESFGPKLLLAFH